MVRGGFSQVCFRAISSAASQWTFNHEGKSRNSPLVVGVRVTQKRLETSVLENTAVENVNRPQKGQRGMVERHSRSKPDQAEKAQIDGMPNQLVRAVRPKLAPRRTRAAQPVVEGSPAILVTQSRQRQRIDHRSPTDVEAHPNARLQPTANFPDHRFALPPAEKESQETDARNDAERAVVKGRRDRPSQ